MQNLPEYFTDQLIFENLASFLDISDLLRLSQSNKALKKIIEQKCKRIIKRNNLTLIPSKTAIHQMRFYFDRCLTIYHKNESVQNSKKQQIQELKQSKSSIKQQKYSKQQRKNSLIQQKSSQTTYTQKLTIESPFKYNTIIHFQVGVQYTAYLTIDNQAYIFKTQSLLNLKQNNKKHLNYQKRLNVVQIKCKSQNLTYLKQNGEVYQIFGNKNSENMYEKEQEILWCKDLQVEKIQASFNYTVFKPKRNNIVYEEFMKYVFNYQINLNKVKLNSQTDVSENQVHKQISQKQQNKNRTTLVLLNNISFKYYLIQFQKQQKIIQMAVGNRQAYFLNEYYQCFVCYFQPEVGNAAQNNENNANDSGVNYNKVLKAKTFHHFVDKTIIKIVSGYTFFLALQRKIHDVSKWSVEQVCKWVRQIGFGQFAKIFMVEKVNGEKLLTIDKNYMYSSLGITKPNMQQKFLMVLSQVIQNKNKQDTLYGWGKNENGQLCSRNANFIKQPQKIKLPNCFKQSEYIDSIFCGWFQTFIRTQKGRVYRTVNNQKKKKPKEAAKQETYTPQNNVNQKKLNNINKNFRQNKKGIVDFQEGYDSQNEYDNNKKHEKQKNHGNNKKNKRKYTQDTVMVKKETGHKKFEQQQKWVECELGKAFFVQGFKQILFYIQCPSQKHFQPTKQKKLRTAKMLLNKIIWSYSVEDQNLYKVGYMDKDMGLIQAKIFELKTFDYNQNRIRYIKRHNQIVWDRENKIDHFG